MGNHVRNPIHKKRRHLALQALLLSLLIALSLPLFAKPVLAESEAQPLSTLVEAEGLSEMPALDETSIGTPEVSGESAVSGSEAASLTAAAEGSTPAELSSPSDVAEGGVSADVGTSSAPEPLAETSPVSDSEMSNQPVLASAPGYVTLKIELAGGTWLNEADRIQYEQQTLPLGSTDYFLPMPPHNAKEPSMSVPKGYKARGQLSSADGIEYGRLTWLDESGQIFTDGRDNKKIERDMTLHPDWQKAYTVYLDPDGGEWASEPQGIRPASYVLGEGDKILDFTRQFGAPKRLGYAFRGWQDASGTEINWSSLMPASDITLKPIWEKAYTLRFDLNGGEMHSESELVEPRLLSEGEIIKTWAGEVAGFSVASLMRREGYRFAGWVDEAGQEVVLGRDRMPARDLKLKAVWTQNQYTLTIESDGEYTSEFFPKTMAHGAPVLMYLPPLASRDRAYYDRNMGYSAYRPFGYEADYSYITKKGYVATAWQDAAGKRITPDYRASADLTVRPVWAKSVTITFMSDGVECYRVEVPPGYRGVWSDDGHYVSKTGYRFLGWAYKNGSPYTGEALNEDTVLEAVWVPVGGGSQPALHFIGKDTNDKEVRLDVPEGAFSAIPRIVIETLNSDLPDHESRAYDITFFINDRATQPAKAVDVALPLGDLDATRVKLYHNTLEEEVDIRTIEDGLVKFTANKFSRYILAVPRQSGGNTETSTSPTTTVSTPNSETSNSTTVSTTPSHTTTSTPSVTTTATTTSSQPLPRTGENHSSLFLWGAGLCLLALLLLFLRRKNKA